jgi:AraC-like DNA-binding protein
VMNIVEHGRDLRQGGTGSASLALREQFNVSLLNVETAPYESLDISDLLYPSWIVSHVLDGCVETVTGDFVSIARSGDVMIHPPNLRFAESNKNRGVHQWMLVDISMPSFVDLFRHYPIPMVVSLLDPQAYARSFERLEQNWRLNAPLRELRCTADALNIVTMVIESWLSAGTPPRPSELATPGDRFAGILSYMREHMAERITRDDLAKLAFLHPGYFDRVFRSAHGMPPMRMLREIRLQRAAQLLERTEQSLDVIAIASGIGDAAQLSRLFRRKYGIAPGRYRESAKLTRQSYIRP